MEEQLKSYRKIAGHIKLLLILGGVWPKLEDDTILYRILGIVAGIISLLSGCKVLYLCLSNLSDISVFITTLAPFISAFTTVIKVFCFLANRKCAINLSHLLKNNFEDDLKIPHYQPILLSELSLLTRPLYVLVYALFITIVGYALTPMVKMFSRHEYHFIYPGKYPFPFEPGGTFYFLLLLFDVMTSWFVGIITGAVDCIFGFYAYQICGQFRVLAERFKNLRYSENYAAELKACVEKHFILMSYRDDMRSVFGVLVIWLVITGALVLCGLIYQALEMTLSAVKVSTFVAYALMKFLQCFIYAYYGAQISAESELCKSAIYESSWTSVMSKRFRSDMIIIMTQRPLIIKVYGYFIVSLDMFVKILNTTISYFFLLQTLADDS